MDDLSQKLSALLNSPDGMDKIRAAAASILGDGGQNNLSNSGTETKKANDNDFSVPDGLLSNIGNMQGIMKIFSLLNDRKEDSRVGLLLALKPHLSSERAKRVDKAISMLKVASILPILQQEGLLDSLGI